MATIPALAPGATRFALSVITLSGQRVLAQRTDDALVICPLDDFHQARPEAATRFPVPWRGRHRDWAVAPDTTLAVFAGSQALRAVESSGRVRWEVRRAHWDHVLSAADFSADGEVVWAHVCGPVPGDEPSGPAIEEWLVLSAHDGRILARANVDASSEGSVHLPHPTDPTQMGLSIGEGRTARPSVGVDGTATTCPSTTSRMTWSCRTSARPAIGS